MDATSYRRFVAADWPDVRAFLLAEGEPVAHQTEVLETHDVHAWLALHDERVIGWILTRPMITGDGLSRGGVEDLVVARPQRGAGIGRALMGLAEGHYREQGFQGMQLTVRADNEGARKMYESLGYRSVEERVRMWKEFG